MTKTKLQVAKGRPLNLRGFPDDLYWLVKECSAFRRTSMKGYIISAVQKAVDHDIKRSP